MRTESAGSGREKRLCFERQRGSGCAKCCSVKVLSTAEPFQHHLGMKLHIKQFTEQYIFFSFEPPFERIPEVLRAWDASG